MRKIIYIFSFICITINLYSQNTININGTEITIQKGISITGINTISIADNGLKTGNISNSGIINFTGDLINKSKITNLGNGEYIFSGSKKQIMSGTNIIGDITINKTSGDITLSGKTKVTGHMSFVKGIVNTSDDNILTLGSDASVKGATTTNSGANDISFVNGPIIKQGNSNFIFPIGKISNAYPLHPLGIEFSESSEVTFRAEYMDDLSTNTGNKPNNVKFATQPEYWSLSQTEGKSSAYVTLWMRDITANNPKDFVVIDYDPVSNAWMDAGNTAFQISKQNDVQIRSGIVNSFTQFTYGIVSGNERKMLEENNKKSFDINLYPNPGNGKDINIDIKKK
jgi:hypothetical protein